MALVTIPILGRSLDDVEQIRRYLAASGIDYERLPVPELSDDSPPEAGLTMYADVVQRLMAEGRYTAADVIDVTPATTGLDDMLARFRSEHWHDEDEVRIIVDGRGLFHIHPDGGPIFAIEVTPGDLIRVPKGTKHWFDLCRERRIRAIRLFNDPAGWKPRYTDSGVNEGFQPLCFGPAYLPPGASAVI